VETFHEHIQIATRLGQLLFKRLESSTRSSIAFLACEVALPETGFLSHRTSAGGCATTITFTSHL